MSEPSQTQVHPGEEPARLLELDRELLRLWRRGERPDVHRFLAGAGPLSPAEIVAVLAVDQRERWQSGERIPAEVYLQLYPAVQTDVEKALELVYGEFLLREGLGETPAPEEYAQRFPQYAARLLQQMSLHRALAFEFTHVEQGEESARLQSTEAYQVSAGRDAVLDTADGEYAESPSPESWIAADESTRDEGSQNVMSSYSSAPPGRYTLHRLHAQGGLGQVWLARDAVLGREIALKELRPERAGHAPFLARFLEEAKITGQLEHPGIVPVYDMVQRPDTNRPFYTMRFIKGHTLSEASQAYHQKRRAGQAPAFEQVTLLSAFVAVCNAVAYAHSRGVIHRDLKGRNVVLGDFGEVIVLDWGLAKLRDRDAKTAVPVSVTGAPALSKRSSVEPGDTEIEVSPGMPEPVHLSKSGSRDATESGQLLGTPSYMAPEQAEGRPDAIDERTDVYGLGALLYEILTGQAPFAGKDSDEVLWKVRNSPPVPPRMMVSTTPAALDAICLKALAKEPIDRYPSAAEVAREVQRYLADEPVLSYREPLAARLRRWTRRHRTLATGLAALLLTAVAALAVGLVLIGRKEREAVAAQKRAEASYHLAREGLEECVKKVADDPRLKQGPMEDLRRVVLESEILFYEKFLALRGNEPAFQAERGEAHGRLANVAVELGAWDKAIRHFDQAIAVFGELARKAPDSASHRLNLVKGELGQSLAYADIGRVEQAEQGFRKSLDLSRQLVHDHPEDASYRALLANVCMNVGALRCRAGQVAAAEPVLREAIALSEGLVQAFPEAADYRECLVNSHNDLGYLLYGAGRISEAEPSYRAAERECVELLRPRPHVPKYQGRLAAVRNNLATLYDSTNRPQEAERAMRQALEIQQALARDHPAITAYIVDIGRFQYNLGSLLKKSGRDRDALEWYTQAISTLDPIYAKEPNHVDVRTTLSFVLRFRAPILTALGRHAEAAKDWERALVLADNRTRADVRLNFALALARQGDHVRAVAEAEALSVGQEKPPDTAYNVACLYALCAATAGTDSRLKEQYAVRAVQLLQKAIAQGYRDVKNLKSDSDLDVLRQRADFKQLLAELER